MSRCARHVVPAVLAAVLSSAAAGPRAAGQQDTGIHIAGSQVVSFPWQVTDGAGFRWDIAPNGQVGDGTNDAYDGGMQLRIGEMYFGASGQGRLNKENNEVQIGPWASNASAVQVSRRIYVDAKVGYCRWIDIFENTSGAPQTIAIQYYSNMGGSTARILTTSGRTSLTDKDWGVVTGYSDESSSRPSLVHVFATSGAKVRPRFRYVENSDNLYYDVSLTIPAGKASALCLFEAQRQPYDKACALLKEFNVSRELSKVPPALRRILVNMGAATLALGNVDLPRHEQHDLAVLRNENELLGKILNERFDLETFYGKLELPAGDVVGLHVPAADDPHVKAVLTSGQVVGGSLLNGPVRIRLANGSEMSLPPRELVSATFALSPDRPEEVKIVRPTLVLRSQDQLAFRPEDLDTTFHTEYGQVKLSPEDLRSIHFDTPEGGLHRVVFRNGSLLSGLLVAEQFKLRLDLGPTLTMRRDLAQEIIFPQPETEAAGLSEMTLRNDDRLLGRIADASLTVTTRHGKVTVRPAEIAELTTPESRALGQVNIKLQSGTSVSGKLSCDAINFQVEPGPLLAVHVAHVVQITAGKGDRSVPAAPAPKTSRASPAAARQATAARLSTLGRIFRLTPEVAAAVVGDRETVAAPAGPVAAPGGPVAAPGGPVAARPGDGPPIAQLEAELKALQAQAAALAKEREALARQAVGARDPAGVEEIVRLRKEADSKAQKLEEQIKAVAVKLAAARSDSATAPKPPATAPSREAPASAPASATSSPPPPLRRREAHASAL